jgi:ABC-type glycerol-3-phosphate transport system substrate-binding protein
MKSPLGGVAGAVLAVCVVAAGGQASAQETLNVLWVKGFYKSEDDALYETIKKFEQKTGNCSPTPMTRNTLYRLTFSQTARKW